MDRRNPGHGLPVAPRTNEGGANDASLVLSGQFSHPTSLLSLTANNAVNSAVYSGTLQATVPEASSYLFLAAGLIAAGLSMRNRRLQ